MNLSEMRQLLDTEGIRLTKSLGQNFLHDTNQLRKIVAAADLSPADKVLEIGPGLGPLTELLIANAGEVLAIEKDARLVQILQKRFAAARQFTLLQADALKFLKSESRDWTGWKLAANLPYSVGSPILVELAQAECPPRSMTVTLQLEVVQRLAAQAGSEDYGILTLLVQLNYEPGSWFKIPASSFFPPPDVDSACITLKRRDAPLLPPGLRPTFAKIVKRSFSQRRKMMMKLLRTDWPEEQLPSALKIAGIPDQARAETVKLEQFVVLTVELAGARNIC